jgi:hypothetical protein
MKKFGFHIKLTRRQLALGLASVVGTGLMIKYGISDGDNDSENISINLPDTSHIGPPSYDQFLALSQLVTCKETLNEDVARKMYKVFLDEPWGPEHIKETYRALHAAALVQSGRREMPELMDGGNIREGLRWFISHLLSTWYLGIYYHEKMPTQRITYEGALMYEALQGAMPIWFTGERIPGYWSKPPNVTDVKKS